MAKHISFAILAVFAASISDSRAQPNTLDSDEVPFLIVRLGDKSFAERELASAALVKIGKPAILRLREATKDGDPERSRRATACLAEIEQGIIVSSLIENLQNQNPDQKIQSLSELSRLGSKATPAFPSVLAIVNGDSWQVRRVALITLARIGSSFHAIVIPRLTVILKDESEHPEVRHSAAIALAQMGEAAECVVPDILRLLSSSQPLLRNAAANALGKLGKHNRDVIPALIQRLGEQDESVRGASAWALGELGQQADICVSKLLDVARNDQALNFKRPSSFAVINAIGRFGPQAATAIPLLNEIAGEPQASVAIRHAALQALAQTGPEARKHLETLADQDGGIGSEAKRLLNKSDTQKRNPE